MANISTDLARVAQSEIEQVRATHLPFQLCMLSALSMGLYLGRRSSLSVGCRMFADGHHSPPSLAFCTVLLCAQTLLNGNKRGRQRYHETLFWHVQLLDAAEAKAYYGLAKNYVALEVRPPLLCVQPETLLLTCSFAAPQAARPLTHTYATAGLSSNLLPCLLCNTHLCHISSMCWHH